MGLNVYFYSILTNLTKKFDLWLLLCNSQTGLLQILQFWISRTTSVFDLKFSPVIGIDNIRLCAKFQFDHLSGCYFTDRSVNSFSLVALDLQKIRFVTWLACILQTSMICQKAWSVKYTLVTWQTWYFVNQLHLMSYIINTYHWWKFQVKSTFSSRD